MASVDKIIPHYTYEDWLHWEGRWELIEGHPIAMSPMPVPLHQKAVADLIYEFKHELKKNCKKCNVYAPLDYKISEDTVLQPDVLIVCNKPSKPYLDFPPVLVVEVLSPSTMLRDRNTKYSFYEQQRIKYYLVVDAEKKLIEIFELLNGQYKLQEYKNQFQFTLEDNCIIAPQLDNIWE